MARIYTRTAANYFQKKNINTWKYVKDGLSCWSKSDADFECKVECPYNDRKFECDCHTQVCKDALEYINEIEAKLADVVPKSEEGAECPTCHGTGRIGTTNWLTKNISKKKLAEEKSKAIAEHEQYIKTEYAREIFAELEMKAPFFCENQIAYEHFNEELSELKKKYTEYLA